MTKLCGAECEKARQSQRAKTLIEELHFPKWAFFSTIYTGSGAQPAV